MGTQLQEWKGAIVASSPYAPKAVAAGWVVTRLFIYEAAILLPIDAWASLMPLPSVSVFIIAFATLTINVICARTDAARLVEWFGKSDVDPYFDRLIRSHSIPEWPHRALTQLIVSFQCSLLISVPLTLFSCFFSPAGMIRTVLFDLPSLTLCLTALLLTPMPLGSPSPHWFPVACGLVIAHLTRSMMSECVHWIDWQAVMKHARWATFALMVWITGRVAAALVWQLPSFVLFYVVQGWLWPTSTGTSVSMSFIVLAGGFTAMVSAAAAIRDWRCIASTLYQRDVSIDCQGVMANVSASFDKPGSRSLPQTNALFIIQLIPIATGMVVGRATYSLSIAILFIAFVAYSQFHAVAWSNATLTIVLPCAPITQKPQDNRPPDEIVGEVDWATESEIKAKAEEVLKLAEQGLEED